jgi:hypothetical protein
VSRPGRPCIFLLPLIALLSASGLSALALAQTQPKPPIKASAIEVLNVQSDEVKLPPEFQMALYEYLIEQITKSGKFQHVYRDGDRAADVPDLVVLHTIVRGFKEGSARARQVTTVAGATTIKVHLQFSNKDGQTVLERDVQGKVRFFGENLRATYDLAKNVAKVAAANFQ